MKQCLLLFLFSGVGLLLAAQSPSVTLPSGGGSIKSFTGQRIGTTDVKITWDAPGVKGREGKIWGTQVAHYGFQNLNFGTSTAAPWRAGANENTTISFSTEVSIEGKTLPAGKYGFFIALYADSCTLIFSKNHGAWGSYFYNPAEDALRVTVRQQKDLPASRERLAYEFSDQTENSATIALLWEHWRIPFRVSVDLTKVVIDNLRRELQGEKGFMYENWVAAAQFCLQRETNLEEALTWAENASGSFFGVETFTTLSLKAQIQEKLGKTADADATLKKAMDKAAPFELHGYGRQLIADKKPAKALEIFEYNYKKHNGTWPTHVGLMRGYSATGDLKKALEHGKLALAQAPDEMNKKSLESSIKTLSEGKALAQ
jgi:tetratricopeptide (TPR) repeat protein